MKQPITHTKHRKSLEFRTSEITSAGFSGNLELAHLKKKKKKKKEERKPFGHWRLSGTFVMLFVPLGMLLVMKTFKDEWFIVIKAYKFTI